MCFTCRGGSRGVGCLTAFAGLVRWGVSAKEQPSRAWGEGEGGAPPLYTPKTPRVHAL